MYVIFIKLYVLEILYIIIVKIDIFGIYVLYCRCIIDVFIIRCIYGIDVFRNYNS